MTMMTHVTKNEILAPVQHSCRAEHSWMRKLLTTDDLVQNYEDKIKIDLIVSDFSKVLDVASYQCFIHKLDDITGLGDLHYFGFKIFSPIRHKKYL